MLKSLTVKYFTVRGRCEPILVLLSDANLPFEHITFNLEEWATQKSKRVDFPSSSMPVLSFNDEDGKHEVLCETGAILRFLDEVVVPNRQQSLISKAQELSVCDTALFYLNRVFQMSRDELWLAGESRTTIGRHIVLPFLKYLENCIREQTLLIPSEEDKLGATWASAFVALLFSLDVFPILEAHTKDGEFLSGCGLLLNAVSRRPRVNAWYTSNKIKETPWTLSRYGTASWIKEAAAQKDDEIFAGYT